MPLVSLCGGPPLSAECGVLSAELIRIPYSALRVSPAAVKMRGPPPATPASHPGVASALKVCLRASSPKKARTSADSLSSAVKPGSAPPPVFSAMARKTARGARALPKPKQPKHPMKNKILIITATLGILCASAFSSMAQTNTVITGTATNSVTANTIPNFFSQAMAWGTSFDTNKSWTPITFQFEDGLNQATGTGAADYIRGQYDINRWNLTAEGDFFGIGSTFNAIEGGGGFALIQKYDFKGEINLLLGTTTSGTTGNWKFKAEPEIKITKLMTVNTYATASISVPWVDGQKFNGTPAFRVGAGFTF